MATGDRFIRRPVRVGSGSEWYGAGCDSCGYPFDPGETAYQTSEEDLVCGGHCGAYMERRYQDREDDRRRQTA